MSIRYIIAVDYAWDHAEIHGPFESTPELAMYIEQRLPDYVPHDCQGEPGSQAVGYWRIAYPATK